MKRWVGLAGFGVLALVVQGALATLIRPPWCPDLALLVVLSIGFRWRGLSTGLCLAALLGFAADLLSGSLMGQHALIRLFAFLAAFFAGRQLNLNGWLPVVTFGAGISLVYGLALFAVSTFFTGGTELSWRWLLDLAAHSVVNGLIAPTMLSIVTRISIWGGDEGSARTLHIDAPGRST